MDCEAGRVAICPKDGANKVGLTNKHELMNYSILIKTIHHCQALILKKYPVLYRSGYFFVYGFCRLKKLESLLDEFNGKDRAHRVGDLNKILVMRLIASFSLLV